MGGVIETAPGRSLWEQLGDIPDRRGRKGRQYGLPAVLTLALDGKRLRGSAPDGHDGSAGVHLVSAFAGNLGGVIGQLRVVPEANEIPAALALLKGLPLQGAVVTGDALFCQRAICRGVRDAQEDYLFAVKANQPELMADIALAFGDAFSPRTGQGAEGCRRSPSARA